MMVCKWEKLPDSMRIPEVRPYYEALRKKRFSLFCKRVFDMIVSFLMLIALAPVFLILAIAIKVDSKGPVFYRQTRLTQYGRTFRIHKFRSMRIDADKGSQVTVDHDDRITRVGKFIRKVRLDEISQLIDVLSGNMTFVGTRPEVPRYVERYTPEMLATLLLPAGITNEACIYYKNEASLLDGSGDADKIYTEQVLPAKMHYNLQSLERVGFWHDVKMMFMTVFAVLGKNYEKKGSTDVSDQSMACK